ncbi:hypothetical protein DOM22_01475 [Bdellovibrio sp. ZAP7]|uniref:hypothetical protein n=1 Tax=Bdellovibrio sp. ZAP7 TaxID=2231053 RepID=UPI00115A8763|nr:hypothetical protein [Bdellovibrio sp. ZAP7]QDK43925.1 hypothetical protein DOM22_01475 [Bdellovibrio sp. ZAP7]
MKMMIAALMLVSTSALASGINDNNVFINNASHCEGNNIVNSKTGAIERTCSNSNPCIASQHIRETPGRQVVTNVAICDGEQK